MHSGTLPPACQSCHCTLTLLDSANPTGCKCNTYFQVLNSKCFKQKKETLLANVIEKSGEDQLLPLVYHLIQSFEWWPLTPFSPSVHSAFPWRLHLQVASSCQLINLTGRAHLLLASSSRKMPRVGLCSLSFGCVPPWAVTVGAGEGGWTTVISQA